eukprot:CAMPEP_0195028724 /NCGR_PEP_ID=MMETSP0326_2-20130528/55048_1 /TAXON_ID=2866 ORGANISM="Crypthecodinium cohnii, Strain Seligo" /NCGR_SAMPLE_ID=MMETSP0326_2 /ASSEMBLY_ACC=CAM_ASM_000348 /LENGTH=116 /DNA_ID=CAMNT_0040051351 /DNA_START=132 /DNA_END=482 /DNA_ORIENTATION=+
MKNRLAGRTPTCCREGAHRSQRHVSVRTGDNLNIIPGTANAIGKSFPEVRRQTGHLTTGSTGPVHLSDSSARNGQKLSGLVCHTRIGACARSDQGGLEERVSRANGADSLAHGRLC